jgi:RHS repeat-associated protein
MACLKLSYYENANPLKVVYRSSKKLENQDGSYYPFGLVMSGISSKAANITPNKDKTFQGQKFDDDLGINLIQFKWRNHDPQIGRFIEIDPLSEKYEYNSTYAFSENKVTSHVELEGLEAVLTDDKKPKPYTPLPINPLAPLIHQGQANIQAENVRTQYNKEAAKLSPTDKQGRADLKEKARVNTPEPFNSIVEKGRPMAGEQAKVTDPNFKGNATKTNIEVNETIKTTGALGKVFIGVAVVQSGFTIANSNNPVRETITEAAGWGGATYVGGQFAAGGAYIGGPWGAFAGGVIGSTVGFVGGKAAGDAIIDNVKKPQPTQLPISPLPFMFNLFF